MARLAADLDQRVPVVVVGPAGVGKTTLCRAVLAARGSWRETGALATLRWSPLLLYRRLLGDATREDTDRVAAQVLRQELGGLLLDDLQWADDLSFDVTVRLAGRLPMLATVRSGDPGSAEAERRLVEAGFERHVLEPLGHEASRAVLEAAHPGLEPSLRRQVLAQAGGNPLLLTELVGDRAASPTLVRALQARLADHPEEVRVAMRRLSVLGRPAEQELLGPGAEALVAAGLARCNGGLVQVHHALLAEAVEEELGATADEVRREMAAMVAPDEGAFLLAQAGDCAAARSLALDAAAGAPRRLQAELLVLAVACAPEGDLDPAHRLEAAHLLANLGQPERALAVCDVEGIETLEPVDRGGLRLVAAEACWLASRPDDFATFVGQAVDDLRGTRTALEVQALAGSTVVQTRVGLDGRPALQRAREAVALADELGEQQGFARYRLASVLLTAGEPGWSDLYRAAAADAERRQDHALRIEAFESWVLGEWIAGDLDAGLALADRVFLEGPPAGFEASWLGLVAYGSILSVLAGTSRDAIVTRWAPLLEEERVFRNRPYAEAALAVALADLGRHAEAREVLASHDPRPTSDPQLASVTGWARTETAWLAGRPADAVAAAQAVHELGVADYPAAVNARLVAAHACRDLGVPIWGTEPGVALPAWAAAPHEWRGLVAAAAGDHPDAVTHFDRAAAGWEGHDRRSEARAAWAAGESARLAGADDAVDRLTAAEQKAIAFEAGDVAARARRSLRASGVTKASARGAGVSGLTAREELVLQRVGDGLTSAEMASELHVSVSTIDSLVRSAMRRLGAPNRRAAAALVRGQDAPEDGTHS